MGTKQLRLSSPELIQKRIHEFLGKQINIVLADSTVTVGQLTEATSSVIILKDMRLNKRTFPLSAVSEIYFDTKV